MPIGQARHSVASNCATIDYITTVVQTNLGSFRKNGVQKVPHLQNIQSTAPSATSDTNNHHAIIIQLSENNIKKNPQRKFRQALRVEIALWHQPQAIIPPQPIRHAARVEIIHRRPASKKSGIVATPGVVSPPIYLPLKSQILKFAIQPFPSCAPIVLPPK
jgi:hypothetical protein